jgi:uncharacterized protein YndB with AHSA1/START domain
MTSRSVVHGTFTVTRTWKASPARVFEAFATEAGKAKWFAGPPGMETQEKIFDFREGGREILQGKHASGMITRFDCLYRDIIPPTAGEMGRLVYSYMMHLDGRKISVSQACIEIRPENGGTKLVLTEYGDFLDGHDDNGSREHGTNFLIDQLGKSLE